MHDFLNEPIVSQYGFHFLPPDLDNLLLKREMETPSGRDYNSIMVGQLGQGQHTLLLHVDQRFTPKDELREVSVAAAAPHSEEAIPELARLGFGRESMSAEALMQAAMTFYKTSPGTTYKPPNLPSRLDPYISLNGGFVTPDNHQANLYLHGSGSLVKTVTYIKEPDVPGPKG